MIAMKFSCFGRRRELCFSVFFWWKFATRKTKQWKICLSKTHKESTFSHNAEKIVPCLQNIYKTKQNLSCCVTATKKKHPRGNMISSWSNRSKEKNDLKEKTFTHWPSSVKKQNDGFDEKNVDSWKTTTSMKTSI